MVVSASFSVLVDGIRPIWRIVFIGILLCVVTLAVYAPVHRHDFVRTDDPSYVTENAHVNTGISLANVAWAFRAGYSCNWHPLTWLSHALDCQLFGLRPGAHHLINLGLHAVNTVLLFLVWKRMTGAIGRSAFLAALFSLHPLHVESVAWVSERKDVLSAFFFLLTLGTYARFAGQPKHERPKSDGQITRSRLSNGKGIWYGLSLVLFAFGLMSKPMLVTVPFLLLLLDFWPLHRFELNTERRNLTMLRPLLLEKVPFFALSAVSSVVTFFVQKQGGAVDGSLDLNARLANAIVSYARYIGRTVWPQNLSVFYPHPLKWPALQVIACLTGLLSISALVVILIRRRPYLAVGWLWFLGMLVPVIGLVQVGAQSMADRYTYLPLIGLFTMAIWGLTEMLPVWPGRAKVFAVGGALVLASLATLTARQLRTWRDTETLFRHATVAIANNYVAQDSLGVELAIRGRLDEAIVCFQDSIRARPTYSSAHGDLGKALVDQGKLVEGIAECRESLRLKPNDALVENYLGVALAIDGKLEEAMTHFYAAVRIKPEFVDAHRNLGKGLARQHKIVEAIAEYEEVLRLSPEDEIAHTSLANLLADQGQLDKAVEHYSTALRINSTNAEAQYNLARILLRQGKKVEAATHYRKALELKPDLEPARRALEKLGEPDASSKSQ